MLTVKGWAVWSLALLAGIAIVLFSSPSFQECIHQPQDYKANDSLQGIAANFTVAFGALGACLGRWIETNSNSINVVATVVIAAFTATLWFTTRGLWRVSKEAADAAKRSADAAILSARAAIGIELPIIRASSPEVLDVDKPPPDEGPYVGSVIDGPSLGRYCVVPAISFRNDGRTHAFPMLLGMGHFVGETLADTPTYSKLIRFDRDAVLKSGDTFDAARATYQISLSDEEMALLNKRCANFWFFCLLAYNDFLRNAHMDGFCWKWGQYDGVGAFDLIPDILAPPTYRRKEYKEES